MSTNGIVLDALGDWTRRQIFDALQSGPQSVGELAARMPVSRPAVSQHLRVLKDAGLVVDRKDGARRIYSVDPTGSPGFARTSTASGTRRSGASPQRRERRQDEHRDR